ncbi:MAG: hypothetical protein PHS77_01710 [Gallionellaceae bacterium]|nr:hypothetical protein [Gallionellaceae bacterium]
MNTNEMFPIEQLASWGTGGPQVACARHALDLMPEGETTRLEVSDDGLLMLGQSEDDLIVPRMVLRDIFGSRVRFSAPRVRLMYADGWRQPITGFRVEVDSRHLKHVEHGLRRRTAEIVDVEVRPGAVVIRGSAPLAGMIGYPRSLQRLADNSARVAIWLSHFAPLWPYSTETMACFAE